MTNRSPIRRIAIRLALAEYSPDGILGSCPTRNQCGRWPEGRAFFDWADSDAASALDAASDRYLRNVVVRVAARLAYPKVAAGARLAAGLTLRLRIARSGALDDAAVKKPCPHDLLCAVAISAAWAAAPFPSHDGRYGDPWNVSIPIGFRTGSVESARP